MSEREDSVDERQRRIGLNEGLFRAVNDSVRSLNEAFQLVTDNLEIVCECGVGECLERLAVPTADYDRIRSDRTLYMLIPGHEIATAEALVEEKAGAYVVVRKHPGGPADLAAGEFPDV